jgi:hypothetical protein
MTDTKMEQQPAASTLGAIDIFVFEFPSNKFTGNILGKLQELVATGTIRVIDLVIITKDDTNHVAALNLNDSGSEFSGAVSLLRATINQMITLDDIATFGEALAPNSTAAILLIENVWMLQTKEAILAADGRLLAFERIPHEIVQEAIDDLAALQAAA